MSSKPNHRSNTRNCPSQSLDHGSDRWFARKPGQRGLSAWLSGGAMVLAMCLANGGQVPSTCDQRAEALISQMFLAAKIGTMTQVDMYAVKRKRDIQKNALSSMLRCH